TMRITEQGEVIQAKYAVPAMALQTLSTYATAVLEASLTPPPKPEKAWRDAMEVLSETSMQSYRGVVQQDADFLDYFHTATPEAELGKLKIGSRPARRKPGRDVAHLRAIPWIFAWTQTRLMLPAWLGVGKALRSVTESGDEEDLKQMKQRWPFFAATLDSIEMVIAKTDPNVVARYDARLVPKNLHALGQELRERFGRTAQAVLMVTGHEKPLEHEPVTLRSISVRNPYTDPLNLLQIELLARVRAGEIGVIEDALLVAINGIAAGMRNTG
ncbi:MAG: phosphoenolpyruvate carboxylase, partial [Gammaproteobacteria bacterium]|nr:phosphoenolpyruvate carboxylase [Gammaproteobacteria bacterium]